MLLRILLLSLQQAVRSIALALFPLIFLAMFAWSTAGSATGNTSDPIRAALWMWLGAHLVPFSLLLSPANLSGTLNFLPLGAVLFPFLALRSGYAKISAEVSQKRAVRIFYPMIYAACATLISLVASTESVATHWYYAAALGGGICLLSTVNFSSPTFHFFRVPGFLLLALLGCGFLGVGISLIAHYSIVKDLSTVIQPGWVGGIFFLFIQVLYLPNFAVSAISYVSGVGFTVGAHTFISPLTFTIHQIPAIPLLASLPSGRHPAMFYFGLIPLTVSLLVVLYSRHRTSSFGKMQRELLKNFCFIGVCVVALSYFSFGSLITSALTPVGVPWWQFTLVILGSIVAAALLTQYLPAGVGKVRNRGK